MNRVKLFSICMALLFPFLSHAQEPPIISGIKINAGLKVGLNLAMLNGEQWENGYRANALGGVFARLHNGRFGVQAEAFFSQSSYTTGKGFKIAYDSLLIPFKDSLKKGTFRVSYLNIPLMVQVKLVSRVWLQLGVQYSGVVSVKDQDEFVKDAGDLFKHSTVSGVGGVWLDLPFHINAGARYVLSFSDTNKPDIEGSWKQRNIQFHIGLTL